MATEHQKAYAREYYRKNRKRMERYRRAYYAANREAICQRRRARYALDPEFREWDIARHKRKSSTEDAPGSAPTRKEETK